MNGFNGFPENLPEETITFQAEDCEFTPNHPDVLIRWVTNVIKTEAHRLSFVNFIFCSDEYLHQLNIQYLSHDTLTDVITFPYSAPPQVEGDIFISIDRVRENARELSLPFQDELHRVMIHGVLHLCGYSDKDASARQTMTARENEALTLLQTYLPS